MDAPALLAAGAPAPRGPQLGGGPGRTRRTPGSAHRRLLLLRDPEDGAQEPRRGEARPAGPGGGDSFVVLLEVARGAAEAPGRQETEPEPGAAASPAGRPAQVPGAAPFVGPRAAGGQDLLVHLERGVLALAAPSRRPPPGQEAASPAGARRASAGPGYRCPEPQCALAFAKKHQLQVHLLTHGGGQGRRPFKCPLDGCGWAFTTSYKLKRHLQSHDKLRPFGCPVGGCGKKFTTVYNLRAHMKGHEQESLFKCEVCAERFPTHAKLSSHQRSHFEPERPYKCDFPGERRRRGGAGSAASLLPLGVAVAPEPRLAARLGQQLGESRRPSPAASGCEKTFITVSALFSHNRAHFREQELFSCSFPGCSKQYDKACRLKIHLRSHTGERPFICDSDSCGWTFTSMSKLLRHKRKHDEDRRFSCPVEGCGKSFTRAEHLKGHSVTHLGTKPFACPVEGRGRRPAAQPWELPRVRAGKQRAPREGPEEDARGQRDSAVASFLGVVSTVEAALYGRGRDGRTRVGPVLQRPTAWPGSPSAAPPCCGGHAARHLRRDLSPETFPPRGCCARFSARSSLYIHSKKHLQDVAAPKSRCPVSSCHRLFSSKHSVKAHVIRQHHRHPDLFPPLGAPSALAPSSDLSSPSQSEFSSVDLAVLFSDTPGDSGGAPRTSDGALRTGILTVDVTSVSSSLGGGLPASQAASGPMGPLVLVAHSDVPPGPDRPLVLGTAATVLQQGSLAADDVQAVDAGALGCLVALPVKSLSRDPQAFTSASGPQGDDSAPELLVPIKVEPDSAPGPDAVRQQAWSGGALRPVESSPAEELGPRKDAGLGAGTGGFYLV
ncbi:hypothetical protein J1605_006406 [Eschrichtius robustus]|uniref:C2H2-type domain-containing protein n=1 Tax=Eschrichtius robustus TaxID=9764 RepID=A0AB34H537_ESCRO|nr:hypothetical protein J1605_006406 [Eschrichtius robustus]